MTLRLEGEAAWCRAEEISDILRTGYATINQQWSARSVRCVLEQPGTITILAVSGCAIIRIAAGEAEVLTIAVAPSARRRGVGGTVLSRALDAAREGGAPRVFLEVAADNAPALALYRRHGFGQAGLRRGYYPRASHRVDALVMALDLSPEPG